MSYFRCGHLVESLAEGGYLYAVPVGPGEEVVHDDDEGGTFTTFEREWILTDEDGGRELWMERPGHAGYTVVLPTGEELEFVRSIRWALLLSCRCSMQRKIGEANEAFLWMVENGMTREELAKCIEKRPSLWGRFENWLDKLPSQA